MTTIDELGARAAATVRSDAAHLAAVRADADLVRIRGGQGLTLSLGRTRNTARRWLILGSAAALIAATIIVVVVATQPDRNHELRPGVPTTDAPMTTTPKTSESNVVSVSAADLPSPYPATVLASVALSGDPVSIPEIAVGDRQAMIVEPGSKMVTVVDWFQPTGAEVDKLGAGQRSYDLPVAPFDIAAGPGQVLYGLVHGDGATMSIVAIALTGDRAGQIVESNPINTVTFVEAPPGVLGHGATGIIDRRTGEQLLPYWDAGSIVPLGEPAHVVTMSEATNGIVTVHDPDGLHDWKLRIERHATSPSPIRGEVPPAPSSYGGAVVWTAVGPPINSTADVGAPSEPVIAVLSQDGSGTWYSLTDGWRVAASDLNGTVLSRVVGNNVEIARVDPPQRYDFLDQAMSPHQRVAFASTLPTTLAAAEPCGATSLEMKPSADGAMGTLYGSLFVHNITTRPCEVQGPPDVAFLDTAGNVVQSTDPGLLAGAPGSPAVVLEPQSWALASLGMIGSNTCGGNESARLRVSLAGSSTTVDFPVGRPFDATSCAASNNVTALHGQLQVEPFGPVPPAEVIDPLDTVDIVLVAPATVRRGEALSYDVVMTAQPQGPTPVIVGVSSDDCPIYSEMLAGSSGQYLLNCNGGVVISPNAAVRFHMRLTIARDAPLGPATLSWATIEPAGKTAIAPVTIEP